MSFEPSRLYPNRILSLGRFSLGSILLHLYPRCISILPHLYLASIPLHLSLSLYHTASLGDSSTSTIVCIAPIAHRTHPGQTGETLLDNSLIELCSFRRPASRRVRERHIMWDLQALKSKAFLVLQTRS